MTPMLHDASGRPLRVGDRVTMMLEVLVIHRGESAGHVTLAVVDVTGAAGAANRPTVTCNAKFATKVEGD